MECAVIAAHRDHAAVATTQPATHHPFDRYLTRPTVPHRRSRGGGKHSLRSAGINHQTGRWRPRRELPVERRDNPAAFAEAAIFRREHELDAKLPEHVQVEELC